MQQILYRSRYDGGDFQSGTEHRWRIRLTQGDIRPTDVAPVIGQSEHGLELGICRWGYRAGEYTQFGVNAIYRRR